MVILPPENTDLSRSFIASLTSCFFCLDSAALLMMDEQQFYLPIWSNPKHSNRRSPVQWYFPLWRVVSASSKAKVPWSGWLLGHRRHTTLIDDIYKSSSSKRLKTTKFYAYFILTLSQQVERNHTLNWRTLLLIIILLTWNYIFVQEHWAKSIVMCNVLTKSLREKL